MKKIKHNHILTDILKVGIFGIFLLLPFLIFIPNAFYYGFNEHAVAQEKTIQSPIYYETNEVVTRNDLLLDHVYRYTDSLPQVPRDTSYYIFNITILPSNDTGELQLGSSGRILVNVNGVYREYNNVPFDFKINSYLSGFNTFPDNLLPYFTICETNYVKEYQPMTTNMSITDSMSYAWDSVWQNDLFSWVDNSILKTPINNFVNVFGVTEQANISQYLTYIFVVMTIYIVADIVIVALTSITHMFNKEPK